MAPPRPSELAFVFATDRQDSTGEVACLSDVTPIARFNTASKTHGRERLFADQNCEALFRARSDEGSVQ